MKTRKAISISLFCLFCFSAAIGLNTVRNVRILLQKMEAVNTSLTSIHSISTTDRQSNSSPFLIMDKKENETETEKLLTSASSATTLDISFFQNSVSYTSILFDQTQENRNTNPIYIAIGNFRI